MELAILARALIFLSVFYRITSALEKGDILTFEMNKNVAEYKICKEIWCEKYSPDFVQTTFPGVLLTNEQYNLQMEIYNESRIKYLQKEGVKDVSDIAGLQGDGDSCCVTNHETHINTSMTNINGQERAIVHMPSAEPPMYQFVPHAYCQTPDGAACDGICVLEYISLTFLIYDPDAKTMVFDQFLLPGYCSCKRVLY